jgi:hypothetical protein
MKFFLYILPLLLCSSCIKFPSCADGKKNGSENDVDCGGECAACPSCYDYTRNQNETGTDCGGVCDACPTCSDGIQNQDETDVDCGGNKCVACCSDGIQNQEEEGTDCGGPCIPCSSTCTTEPQSGQNFYLPGQSAPVTCYGYTLSQDFKYRISCVFSEAYQCKEYEISFYESSFLSMPAGNVQVLTTSNYNDYHANGCYVEMYMQLGNLSMNAGQKVYLTKLTNNTFNIKFCGLEGTKQDPYIYDTFYSVNANFTK